MEMNAADQQRSWYEFSAQQNRQQDGQQDDPAVQDVFFSSPDSSSVSSGSQQQRVRQQQQQQQQQQQTSYYHHAAQQAYNTAASHGPSLLFFSFRGARAPRPVGPWERPGGFYGRPKLLRVFIVGEANKNEDEEELYESAVPCHIAAAGSVRRAGPDRPSVRLSLYIKIPRECRKNEEEEEEKL